VALLGIVSDYFDFWALVSMSQTDAARYRAQAADCRTQAELSLNLIDKDAWLVLASDWTRLAESTEWRDAAARPGLKH
jgi:hypothetical protein